MEVKMSDSDWQKQQKGLSFTALGIWEQLLSATDSNVSMPTTVFLLQVWAGQKKKKKVETKFHSAGQITALMHRIKSRKTCPCIIESSKLNNVIVE